MEFVSLGAMVVTLRGVVVGDFPIQIAKMKTRLFKGSRVLEYLLSECALLYAKVGAPPAVFCALLYAKVGAPPAVFEDCWRGSHFSIKESRLAQ